MHDAPSVAGAADRKALKGRRWLLYRHSSSRSRRDTQTLKAVAEGINRIVKIVKNRASGFRHLHSFADMIYLTVGDLDIPAQIPRKFRAI